MTMYRYKFHIYNFVYDDLCKHDIHIFLVIRMFYFQALKLYIFSKYFLEFFAQLAASCWKVWYLQNLVHW